MQIRSPVDLKFVQEKEVSFDHQQPGQMFNDKLEQIKQQEGHVESRLDSESQLMVRYFQLNRMPGVCRQYFCPYVKCLKQFKHSGDLRIHFRTHVRGYLTVQTNERPYTCKYCQSSFGKKALLNEHLILQTQETQYRCQRQGCTATFVSNCLLRKHLREMHSAARIISDKPKVPKQLAICAEEEKKEECLKQEEESGSEELKQEVQEDRNQGSQPSQEKNEVCFICGKKFAKRFSLQDHLFSHTMNSSFKCNFCDKTFKRERTLRIHKRLKHSSHIKQEPQTPQQSKIVEMIQPIQEPQLYKEVQKLPEQDTQYKPASLLGLQQPHFAQNFKPLYQPSLSVNHDDTSAHLALIALQQQKIPLLEALTRQLQKQNAQRILHLALVNEARQNLLASQLNPMMSPFMRPQIVQNTETAQKSYEIKRPMPIYPKQSQWPWVGVRSNPGAQLNPFNH